MTEPNEAAEPQLLSVLEKISEQQTAISGQLSELLDILTTQPETSLIEQLSELLAPLFSDIADIKTRVASTPDAVADSTHAGETPTT